MDPISTGVVTDVASEAAKGIFQQVIHHVRYVINCEKIVQNFEEKRKTLIAKREGVQQKIAAAERNVEKILPEVKLWCERVDETIGEKAKKVKDLEDKAKAKCFLDLCPNIKSRYQLSKRAEADVVDVDELLQQCQFDEVAIRDVPKAISAAPENFKAFDSRKEVFDEIIEALKDSTTSIIGVYGPGGVGKTTLVDEIARQVEEITLFAPVVKATVTRTPKIEGIQNQIAESLGLKLEDTSIQVRASWLSERLKKEKNILVVLDDLWAGLDLKKVGITFGDQQKKCKILLTSRKRNVLTNEMDAKKTFAIGVLEEKEAWDLFKNMTENDFEDPELLSVATEVTKRCGGFPLAIVTVARALRNKELYEWKDASLQLQRPNFTEEIPAAVYSAIELSYKHLESEQLKQTFLLGCLLGHNALIQDLLRCAMGLRLFAGLRTVEETRNRVLALVSSLKSSCLLIDGYDDDRFSTHDFVSDVALAIAYRDNLAFGMLHSEVAEDWPDEERMDRFEMISLRFTSIKKLPPKLDCPQLSLFSMGTNTEDSYLEMPTSFFEKTKNIKVLDLFQMDLSSSIILPTNLRTLCLEDCMLGDMINLGKLKNLEILSFSDSTNIEMLPKEIGELTKLKLLDLSYCYQIKIIPPGILSSLSSLEELFIYIPDAETIPKDLFSSEKLQRYKILIGDAWDWDDKFEYSRTIKLDVNSSIDHLDNGFKRLLKITEALYLENLEDVKIVLEKVENRDCFLHLKHLHIRKASQMQYIMNDNDAIDKIAFRQLRSLTLENLPRLISFCSKKRTKGSTSLPLFGEQMELPCLEKLRLSSVNVGSIWHNKFSTISDNTHQKLTKLIIKGCGNLKYVLSSSMARSLVNLKSFKIFECKSLREIILNEEMQEEETSTGLFPHLSTLRMKNLRRLIGFCSENYNMMRFPSLKTLVIEHCPKFKGFIYKSIMEENQPLSMRTLFDEKVVCPNLEQLILTSIKVERIWHDQTCYIQNLKWVTVESCQKLRCLFSSSMLPLLNQLQDIFVSYCGNVEEVIFKEGVSEDDKDVSQTLPNLRNLQLLYLPKLMRFCHGSSLEFPSLIKLTINNCPRFQAFINSESRVANEAQICKNVQGNSFDIDFPPLFNEKVAFPKLERLKVIGMSNHKKIWHDELTGDSFFKLREIRVVDCDKLRNVFPFNISERLQNLEVLEVIESNLLEEIFGPQVPNANELQAMTATQSIVKKTVAHFVFPKLTYLEFYRLPVLKRFYSSEHTTRWPSLKKMWLYGCDMVEISFASENLSFGGSTNQQPLFWVNKVTFPNLEELKLEYNDILKQIWHGQCRASVFNKLSVLELIKFPDTAAVFPHLFIQSLPNLEKLVVSDAAFSQIFNLEGFGGNEIDALALTSLTELRLTELPQLTHLWKEEYKLGRAFCKLRSLEVQECGILKTFVPSSVSFNNLTELEVSGCQGLENLMAFSTAKSLVQLTTMSIINCEMIGEIIAGEGDKPGGIAFTQLQYLKLSRLPRLSSFCLRDHNFEFPTLETMIVIECPKMQTFCQGDLSTPQLQKVMLTEDEDEDEDKEKGRWEGNLKTTIMLMFEEMNVQSSEQD